MCMQNKKYRLCRGRNTVSSGSIVHMLRDDALVALDTVRVRPIVSEHDKTCSNVSMLARRRTCLCVSVRVCVCCCPPDDQAARLRETKDTTGGTATHQQHHHQQQHEWCLSCTCCICVCVCVHLCVHNRRDKRNHSAPLCPMHKAYIYYDDYDDYYYTTTNQIVVGPKVCVCVYFLDDHDDVDNRQSTRSTQT